MFVKLNINFIGISVGIMILYFLALVLLLSKNGNRKANSHFAVFLMSIGYEIFGMGILISSRLYQYLPHLVLTAVPTFFLLGPALLFYVRKLTDSAKTSGWRKNIHFLPFIFSILYLFPFFLKSGNDKIMYIQNWINIDKISENFIADYFLYILIYIHTLVYIHLTGKKIQKYNTLLKDSYSAIEKRNLNWLEWCLNVINIMLLLIVITLMVLYLTSNFRLRYSILPFIISVFSCAIAYKAIIQPVIVFEEKPKTRKKVVDHQKMTRYQNLLLETIENEKLYRNPDLSLGELSEILNIGRNILSYVINNHLNTNFYEFVNTYRLQEVKHALKKGIRKDNLQSIANSAGFNSKTTFNVLFKKYTGTTPSQYRKKHLVANKNIELIINPDKTKSTFFSLP